MFSHLEEGCLWLDLPVLLYMGHINGAGTTPGTTQKNCESKEQMNILLPSKRVNHVSFLALKMDMSEVEMETYVCESTKRNNSQV